MEPGPMPDTFVIQDTVRASLGYDVSRLSSRDHSSDESSGYPANANTPSEEENYDNLEYTSETLVKGSKGAGAEEHFASERQAATTARDAPSQTGLKRRGSNAADSRRRSIQVTLEKTGKKGRYILTADDPELRDILRAQIERETQKPTRTRFRELVFTRRFTTFDRQNPLSAESPFHGFFTLFWLAIAMMLVKIAAQNWREHGSVFGEAQLLHMMFDRDVLILGLTDGVMCAATLFGVGLQKLILKGYLSWKRSGWIIQHVWQTLYLAAVLAWTLYREWPWTHTVFIVLHGLVFIMKQHSYAFYNGYLSQVYRRKGILEQKLAQLEDMQPTVLSPSSPTTSPSSPAIPPSSPDLDKQKSNTTTNLKKEHSEIAAIAAAIDSGQPLDEDQMEAFSSAIQAEILRLDEELIGKCTNQDNRYPRNLTLANWADWTCLPTLVYELEYPRQDSINWWYVAEKSAATFGVIWIMMVVSQAYIYPHVVRTVRMKDAGMTFQERWVEFPWVVSDLIFPLLLEQLLTWYVIWECCLNVLAEVTRFADRGFYGDWWNSVSWDQYARDWNRPVHNFLLRHVYHSSISALHLSKGSATFVTFLLSACVHELIMLCLFRKVRGFLFAMQLSQIPLAWMSRTKMFKGRDLLGNLVFWFGLFVGPSFLTALYLIV
ncbi:hypothetical protein EJ06DRAFT_554865 [Trichodelitschia bisporula]|uniref:O-acyltransferase n=1 Tax=Trichodelitschia bisporula TaxID=703511 RepID=A0A6G1I1Q1_9PEZI|nr:hypothetical protein EJ06DRAFT_554865 [Trichodelitschia bisporula]